MPAENFASDSLFLIVLLSASVGVGAICLWASHVLGLAKLASKNAPGGSDRGARTLLAIVPLGVCMAMMLGLIPGAQFLHPWTALSCVGGVFLSILAIVAAQRPGTQTQASGAKVREAVQVEARKAA